MSKQIKYIVITNRKYYFFNDIMNIENFDPNNIKIDEVIQRYSPLLCWISDDQKILKNL